MPLTPLEPPYDPEVAAALQRWLPPGSDVEPLALFRVLARHTDLFARMRPLGAGILARGSLPARDRELLIHRTTARVGAGYEWGVHAVAFAPAVGITEEQLLATAVGAAHDPGWNDLWDDNDRLVLAAADSLFERDRLHPGLVEQLEQHFSSEQVLEMIICCGWYRLLATVILTAGLGAETWAKPFPGVGG